MELNREEVLKVLGNIIEPDLKKDIVSLNLIENLEVSGQKVALTVAISNPALHARKRMQEAIQFNLKRFFGEVVEIEAIVKGMASEHKEKRRKIWCWKINNYSKYCRWID
jgi:ATP-binding protein involved in chromosome partitioning